eukprot:scaffold3599_cov128-Isochrysis_galbana.AAC.1
MIPRCALESHGRGPNLLPPRPRKNSARAWRGHDGAAPASAGGWSPLRWSRPRTKVQAGRVDCAAMC